MDGDLLKGRRFDKDVPADKVGFLGAYERFGSGRCPPGADQLNADEAAQVVRPASHDPVALQDLVPVGTGPEWDSGQSKARTARAGS
jgi:hypothetical protein